jgi:uncharacterized membrane protein HdeD (DUF308 family)
LLALSGVVGVIFGIVALVWPNITLLVLLALFGAYALVTGALSVGYGINFATHGAQHWVPMVLGGVAGILIGVLTFFRPGITALAFVFVIAAWAILTGVFEMVAGIELTGMVKSAWTLWLSGLVSVAFGVLIAVRPSSGALALIWIIGIYAILGGLVRLFAAYRVRSDVGAVKGAVRSMERAPIR